jgi:hypothetical protein
MSNSTLRAQQPNNNVKMVLRVAVLLAIALIGYGVYDYIQWMSGTTVDPQDANANGEVKGAENCQNIENVELWSGISGEKSWFLLGDEFSKEEKALTVSATIDESKILDSRKLRLQYEIQNTDVDGDFVYKKSDKSYTAKINTSQFEPGTYTLSATAENACSSSVSPLTFTFNVSYPVYVIWSIDWEGSDVKQEYLDNMTSIANTYNIPMTHFFNPRIYLTSVMKAERANYLTNYVLEGKETRGDAIGLHLHMFPDMVAAAGVTPQYSPAWGWSRTDGYDILVSGYSYDKMNSVLDWSVATFVEHGLGTPTMFRAGGWFADEGTLRVLEDNGFVLDSSGRTSYTLGTNNVATYWNLLETTQPYHPSYSDQNSVGNPGMDLWEFPNNGGDSWSLSKDEMYARYRANYAGGAASKRSIVIYLSHPDWFNVDKPKMEGLFTDIGNDLYASDKGPVIYTTIEEVYHMMVEVE